MTATVASAPFTARAILIPRGDVTQALSYELGRCGLTGQVLRTVKHLSSSGQWELQRQLVAVAGEVLELDVVGLIARTLQMSDALIAAAQRTIGDPSSMEIVQLFAIPIPWATQAEVQLLVNEISQFRIQYELKVVLEVEAEAAVRNGTLIAIQSGQCKATVTLIANEVTLVTNQVIIDLVTYLPLGHGIPLTSQRSGARWDK